MTVISLEQTAPKPNDPVGNLADIHRRLGRAIKLSADLVVFPELAHSGYVVEKDQVDAAAEPVEGPFISGIVDMLRGTETLVATGLCEADGESRFNSVVVVGADGPLLTYRKTHLFDQERVVYTPGDDLSVLPTRHGALGICVCYDLRFVEVMRLLALEGAEIVLAPAAWVLGFDSAAARAASPEPVPQAQGAILQANLNQVAVVAVSQVGATPVIRALGGSVAADAYGRLLGAPLSVTDPESRLVKIDLEEVRAARVRGPHIRPREDRRTDIYAIEHRGRRL